MFKHPLISSILQEVALLSRLRHPNIVQYYGSEMVSFQWSIDFLNVSIELFILISDEGHVIVPALLALYLNFLVKDMSLGQHR